MLINYFDSSSVISTYQKNFKKTMIERVYCFTESFLRNVKMVPGKILEGQPQKFFGWLRPFLPLSLFTSDLSQMS